jgi:4-diphosphocytidyl-2-C-methyl-D-erythritol kinase
MADKPARRRVRVRAFAKINLTLHVVGRRPDGYHELRTAFQSLALHDTLTFTATRGPFEIHCDDVRCPTGPENLVWAAAARLWRAAGRRGELRGARVDIRKRIPVQAGLGGGSSDASATLRALTVLWRQRLSSLDLQAAAASLGADVPYFLQGGAMLGEGRGDVLAAAPEPPASWVVLALPEFGISTNDAYAWLDQSDGRPTGGLHPERRNDLEPVVARRHPEIARLVSDLARLGARQAAMSGSGSAVFGLFSSRSRADRAARSLAHGGNRAIVTRTIDRREYGRLSRPRAVRRT